MVWTTIHVTILTFSIPRFVSFHVISLLSLAVLIYVNYKFCLSKGKLVEGYNALQSKSCQFWVLRFNTLVSKLDIQMVTWKQGNRNKRIGNNVQYKTNYFYITFLIFKLYYMKIHHKFEVHVLCLVTAMVLLQVWPGKIRHPWLSKNEGI